MIFRLAIILISILSMEVALGQTPPANFEHSDAQSQPTAPQADASNTAAPQPTTTAPVPDKQSVEELLDGSGLVINKNTFSYDGSEGRDPFKVFREFVQPTIATGGTGGGQETPIQNMERSIRTILVPEDIVVQGILYKKSDPIALVVIKGEKGLHKLRLNSLVGRNEGKVVDIRQDKIIIEQVKDFDGQKFTEKVVLEVRKKKK